MLIKWFVLSLTKVEFNINIFFTLVRNPETAIQLALDTLLKSSDNLGTTRKDLFKSMKFASQEVISILEAALVYSRLLEKKVSIENSRFRLEDLLTNVEKRFKGEIAYESFSLLSSMDKIVPLEIFSDFYQLEKVFIFISR